MRNALVVFIVLFLASVTYSFADSPRVTEAGFVVQNADEASYANVNIFFSNPDGSEAHQVTRILDPNSSLLIDLDDIDELTPGWAGSAVISSDRPLFGAGWAETFSKYGKPEGLGWYNLPSSITADTTVYVPVIRNDPANGFGFNLWIQNAGSATASVTVTYYASVGGSSYGSTCPDLAPGASLDSINSCSASLPASFVGSAVVLSSQPVVVVANQSNGAKRTECLYNGIPGSGADEELFFPIVLNSYQNWYSSFTVQNMGTSEAQGVFDYYADGCGTPCDGEDTLSSAPIGPAYGYMFIPVTSSFSGYGRFFASGKSFGGVASVRNEPAGTGYCYNGFRGGTGYPVPEESSWYLPGVNGDSQIVVKNTNESTGGTLMISWSGVSGQQTVELSANDKKTIIPAVPAGWSGNGVIQSTAGLPLAIVVQNVQPGSNDRGAYNAYGTAMGVTSLVPQGEIHVYVPRVRKAENFLSTIWKVYNPAILKGTGSEQ